MQLSYTAESWPIRGIFSVSRGSKTKAHVVVVALRDGAHIGRGECVPYSRYGETVESVQSQIEAVKDVIERGMSKDELPKLLPEGAARNALDCALWDLEAKRKRETIWELVGIENPKPMPTACTVSLAAPEEMAEAALRASEIYSLLKIKLGEDGDDERLQKIRAAVPSARLIVDVNEGWNADNLETMVRACESAGVELIEQPLSVGNDETLQNMKTTIKICADESAHTTKDIPKLVGRYSVVNIKLDKTGGLTEALAMARKAKNAGLSIMVGCHVSTSLSMAPATVVAQMADYVDLDGPLLLERDRELGIIYRDGKIYPPTSALWG